VSTALAPAAGPELWFYHLERSGLEDALSLLLDRCVQRGWRALVVSPAAERLAELDEKLWTARDDSFLPHARAGKPNDARQPILLSASPAENANQAQALFLLDQAWHERLDAPAAAGFARVSLMFDGGDSQALASARTRWTAARKAGWAAAYFKETSPGKWEKQER
jgi:DNA polymerase III subunit chi